MGHPPYPLTIKRIAQARGARTFAIANNPGTPLLDGATVPVCHPTPSEAVAGSTRLGEITGFNAQADFEIGAFPPPVPNEGDECYISDHTDIAIGLDTASPNAEAALTFLEWVGSEGFATLYSNALPGFFSLSDFSVEMEDPLAQEFVSWRQECQSTIRSTYQILSRGRPNLENETWNGSAQVIRGAETPEDAAARLQEGLASWYAPQ